MNFWKLFAVKGFNKRTATDFTSFAENAKHGPADCVIVISEWLVLYETLGKVLMNSGMTAQVIVGLVNKRLIGVCPKCRTLYPGEGLATLSMMHDGLKIINAPPDAYRVLEGHCRNDSCTCKKMMIFWKPDEDRNAISRLAGLGINVRPKV